MNVQVAAAKRLSTVLSVAGQENGFLDFTSVTAKNALGQESGFVLPAAGPASFKLRQNQTDQLHFRPAATHSRSQHDVKPRGPPPKSGCRVTGRASGAIAALIRCTSAGPVHRLDAAAVAVAAPDDPGVRPISLQAFGHVLDDGPHLMPLGVRAGRRIATAGAPLAT
jgi:hypothetical protein